MIGEDPRDCPFCALIAAGKVDMISEHAAAFPDQAPVSPGHTLIVARRHVASWFDLSTTEQSVILELANAVQARLERSLRPAGFNLGVNAGPAAGQRIAHAHLHLVPRYDDDHIAPPWERGAGPSQD